MAKRAITIECKTQAELDACCGAGNIAIVRSGYFEARLSAQVTACGSSQVTAYDSSQVTACGSSQVTACDSSQVRAYDSSQVTACGSSQVRAKGNVFIRLLSALKIEASISVIILAHTHEKVVTGGQVIWATVPETAEQWCDLHDVEVRDGVATLYKALNEDFTSPHGANYAPGQSPEAADWDDGKAECGGGLHFSPSPAQALSFHGSAKRFAACFVRLSDMRAPAAGDQYPEKAKAKGCCAPCVECDINGNLIEARAAA